MGGRITVSSERGGVGSQSGSCSACRPAPLRDDFGECRSCSPGQLDTEPGDGIWGLMEEGGGRGSGVGKGKEPGEEGET